jgi:hypothetical protein
MKFQSTAKMGKIVMQNKGNTESSKNERNSCDIDLNGNNGGTSHGHNEQVKYLHNIEKLESYGGCWFCSPKLSFYRPSPTTVLCQ